MTKDRKVTAQIIDTVLETLPKEMDSAEISAMLMTLTNTYIGEAPKEAIHLLLTTTIIYAKSVGVPTPFIAAMLQKTADSLTEDLTKQRIN